MSFLKPLLHIKQQQQNPTTLGVKEYVSSFSIVHVISTSFFWRPKLSYFYYYLREWAGKCYYCSMIFTLFGLLCKAVAQEVLQSIYLSQKCVLPLPFLSFFIIFTTVQDIGQNSDIVDPIYD